MVTSVAERATRSFGSLILAVLTSKALRFCWAWLSYTGELAKAPKTFTGWRPKVFFGQQYAGRSVLANSVCSEWAFNASFSWFRAIFRHAIFPSNWHFAVTWIYLPGKPPTDWTVDGLNPVLFNLLGLFAWFRSAAIKNFQSQSREQHGRCQKT